MEDLWPVLWIILAGIFVTVLWRISTKGVRIGRIYCCLCDEPITPNQGMVFEKEHAWHYDCYVILRHTELETVIPQQEPRLYPNEP